MRTVTVSASKKYDVIIAGGILAELGARTAALGKVKKAAVITDSNVEKLYLEAAVSSLEEAGLEVYTFSFLAGEASKNGETFLNILNFLADNKLARTDIVIALGGGVVGDIAGFAASVYLRGIRFVGVPTTLLSAVDSSVGGKTAIDLNAGKNLAGTFCQPSLVLCDTDTFATLSESVFSEGVAEVIKYGGICDEELFEALYKKDIREQLEDVVARCIELKSEIVAEDEFDTGRRQLLNYGHTAAHAIEALSALTVPHGRAVAAGMAIITRAAAAMGICDALSVVRLQKLLLKYSLPTGCEYSAKQLADIAANDKKIASGRINLVMPRKMGECFLYNVDVEDVMSIFERGLQ